MINNFFWLLNRTKTSLKTGREIRIDRKVKKLPTNEDWKHYKILSKGEKQLIKLQRELNQKKQGGEN